MANVLLTSPDFVRENTNISDNVNSKVLSSAIREVQEDELQEILGQLLLEKLKELVANGGITSSENKVYKYALDKAQMFIAYKVVAETIMKVNFKIDNAGLIQTRDDNMDYVNLDDSLTIKNHYEQKADHWCYLLQNYLMEHLSEIPELTECQAWKIRATLYSAANPSVFLGGARGRGWFRFFPYRYQRGMNWPGRRN